VANLFPDGLPVAAGPIPTGLANRSAQGCNACHYQAHDTWAHSAHATGFADPAFREAVAEAGTPACRVCHQPLAEQAPQRAVYASGDPNEADQEPNPTFDATLYSEGVTCAACHVRDGKIVASHPPAGKAPHPVTWSDSLTSSSFCAACHELTWPGADKPFYDTYGEWRRSPQGAAGIQCQDCHMGQGASGGGRVDHDVTIDPARAVSLLVDVDHLALTRGGDPLNVTIRLQNTGAGHAVPTGSPFVAVVLKARLLSPPQVKGDLPAERSVLQAVLGRTLSEGPPWTTTTDTRLQAGGERQWFWQPALEIDDPRGDWFIEVSLTRTVRGQPDGDPFLVRRIPLDVD